MQKRKACHLFALWTCATALLGVGCAPSGDSQELMREPGLERSVRALSVPTGSMAEARSRFMAVPLLDGRVLVGGQNTQTELYNPATGAFSYTGSRLAFRADYAATRLNDGRVLVAGGYDGTMLHSVEIYNPATGTWSSAAPMAQGRANHRATLLADGRVLVTGGNSFVPSFDYLNSCEIYDPVTNSWSPAAPLSVGQHSHTATLLADGRVFVTGGFNAGLMAIAALYSPATNTWTSVAPPTTGLRYDHQAFALADGSVLIAGGKYVDSSSGDGTETEVFDVTTGAWSSAGNLGHARFCTQGVTIDGAPIMIGGDSESEGPLDSVEKYDATTRSWISLSRLLVPRACHAAVVLPDGLVLVAGGGSEIGAGPLTTAELYTSTDTCTPMTCQELGKNCGPVSDGCGGTLDCGTCSEGATCNLNVCEAQSTCAHSECSVGAPLSESCGVCAATVCAADPYCCAVAWDGICANRAVSMCGLSCS